MQTLAAPLFGPAHWPLAVLVAAPLLAFGVGLLLVWLLRHQRIAVLRILDHPNERSLHSAPVPRTGGVGVLGGVAVGLLAALPWLGVGVGMLWPLLATLVLAVVSLLDDRRHVPARYRLFVHLFAGGLLYVGGIAWVAPGLPGLGAAALPGWLGALLTVVFVVWMINLYNFMDGMDGLAGGMALFGFGALALLGFGGGAPQFGLVAAVIAAAAGGFLPHNLPRAGIFLGDVGSAVLHLDAAPAPAARRAGVAGASRAPLPAPGARRLANTAGAGLGLCADGRGVGERHRGRATPGLGAMAPAARLGGPVRAGACTCAPRRGRRRARVGGALTVPARNRP